MVKRRKSTVQPPPQQCSLRECTRLLSGAWTPDVLWYLKEGERCFSELQSDLRGISARMLTARLRMLERHCVVERKPRPTSPPTVWYALTPLGQELFQALAVLVDIGARIAQTGRRSASVGAKPL